METLLIVCDCIALVGLMLWVIQNEGRGGGAVTGLFRYRSVPPRNSEVGPSEPPRPLPGSYRRPPARR